MRSKYTPYNRNPASARDPFMTLEEIADRMGMSRERVIQIEESALRKCRKKLRLLGVSAEDFFSTLKYDKPIRTSEGESPSNYELMYDKEELND